MDPVMIRVQSPAQALIVEQAWAFAQELERVASSAADGHVLAQAEKCAVDQGRELLRFNLQTILQAQAERVEKKGSRPAPALRVASGGTTKGERRGTS